MRRTHVVVVAAILVTAIVVAGVLRVFSSSERDASMDFGGVADSRSPPASVAADAPINARVSADTTVREAAGRAVSAEGDSSTQRTWSDNPDVMESLILAELQQIKLPATSIDPIECSETECLIRFTSLESDPYPNGIRSFLEPFQEAPIAAVDARWGFETTDAGYVYTVTLSSERFPVPSRELVQFAASADMLRELAADSLAPDDYNADPSLIFNSMTGDQVAMVVAENICTYDCSEDGRQVIYIVVPEGVTCEQLRGVEQQFMARNRAGGLEERSFCIPNTLVGE